MFSSDGKKFNNEDGVENNREDDKKEELSINSEKKGLYNSSI